MLVEVGTSLCVSLHSAHGHLTSSLVKHFERQLRMVNFYSMDIS